MTQRTRPHAFETDDGALRCYLDQLPPDRCVFCDAPSPARLIRVAAPVHHASSFEQLADGSAMDRLAAGAALLGGRLSAGVERTQTMQTKGRAWLSVCKPCSPNVALPAIASVLLLGSTIAYGAVAGVGGMLGIVLGGLATMTCFTVAVGRTTLRVGEIDEDDHMFKLRKVAPEIVREVVALGPAPHPQQVARSQQLVHHVHGSLGT
jgi:hypothetical protein